MNLLRRREDIVCRQVAELVNDYLENVLPRAQRKRFEHHLAGCPNCTAYLEQIRATVATVGRLTPADFSPEVSREFTELYRAWRDEGPAPADGSG